MLDTKFKKINPSDSRLSLRIYMILVAAFLSLCCVCSALAKTVYVNNASSASLRDGLTWGSAYLSIQDGINSSVNGDEVWVAKGAYSEQVTLKDGVAIYGGFRGIESVRQMRYTRSMDTIISYSAASVIVSPTGAGPGARIDGFFITGGIGTLSGNYKYGGGVFCKSSSPTIANNIIQGNGSNYGGGISVTNNSSPVIANNVILSNTATVCGGGIYCSGGSPVILNNTICECESGEGGGIFLRTSPATVTNNVVSLNSSGIGVLLGASVPALQSNCVNGNTAYEYSGIADPTGTNGNISLDPGFVNASGGDYRLRDGSPCIDSGVNSDILYDKDGCDRTQDGDGIGVASTDIGAYEASPAVIGTAKRSLADGLSVAIGGAVVVGVFPSMGYSYVENTNRVAGIRINTTVGLTYGQFVNIKGVIRTDPMDGERYIDVSGSPVDIRGADCDIAPLYVGLKNIGGGAFGLQQGINGAVGLNNLGLRVCVSGKLTTTGQLSSITDGTFCNESVNVFARGLILPPNGSYIRLVGISSVKLESGMIKRRIMISRQNDISLIKYPEIGSVSFDAEGICRIDGVPFFPICIYHADSYIDAVNLENIEHNEPAISYQDMYAHIAAKGFNTVAVWDWSETPFLDIASAYGLKVIRSADVSDQEFDSLILRYRDHPALLAWGIYDEPVSTEAINIGAARYQELHSGLDLRHPAHVTQCAWDWLGQTASICDVLAPDSYYLNKNHWWLQQPWWEPDWTSSTRMVTMGMDYTRQAFSNGRPLWSVIQAFGDAANFDEPNLLQLRNMVYQAVVAGARGISFYTYTGPERTASDRYWWIERSPLWDYVGSVVSELNSLQPVLLAPGGVTLPVNGVPDLKVLKRVVGSKTYVFAVNIGDYSQNMHLTNLGSYALVKVVGENRTIPISGGVLNDSFAPLAVHIYELD